MALTRAQLLMGNRSQGAVLPGQVQAVKQGAGISIASDGTLSFNAASSVGVIKTNNVNAYINYVWPSSTVSGGQLSLGSNGELSWVVKNEGFGLDLTGSSVKVSLPFGSFTNPDLPIPSIGEGVDEAIEGSLYWNSESQQLFINVDSSWVPASFGPSDVNQQLLSGSYTFYVNPEIGSDEYVLGVYDPTATPVVTNQMVTAGYTPQKPFKTLQRAALEVARIQADPQPDISSYDRFVIKCSAGEHIIDNTPGGSPVTVWTGGTVPTQQQLRAMNSASYAGVILPRGVSIIGDDLRKTIIRPAYVPAKTGSMETGRGSILRITGGAFFFNFTFKDKQGLAASHHLLDCFSFVSDADLTEYYSKAQTIFSQAYPNLPVNPGETEIVAPKPEIAEETTDGTLGSSPYIFNCSVRSNYGICGINADGEDVDGFKSMVVAQFTGVSLQRDLSCWQRYNPSLKNWENTITTYKAYIDLNPNNLRMDPTRSSYHIRAINGAFIQEVSVFAIGHGIHHWAKNGGEISITNSNSSFGGCAALAEGYGSRTFPQDMNWDVGTINVATSMEDQTTLVSSTYLGVVAAGVANNATTLILTQPLVDSALSPGVPEILASGNYTLKPNSYLWVENTAGPDWRSRLTATAWDPAYPNQIKVTVAMQNQEGNFPGQDQFSPDLVGSRVYIRRMIDNRTTDQRRVSLNVANTDNHVRNPPRDYIIQTNIGGTIAAPISDTYMTYVSRSGPSPIGSDPVIRKSQIVLQRANPSSAWAPNTYYRPGDTVRRENKHYTCIAQNKDSIFDINRWDESYVHMESSFNAYDYRLNEAPVIHFDDDTDGNQPSLTCGYDLATCWSLPDIRAQYSTASDYRGVWYFLIGLGFSPEEAADILIPRSVTTRELDPSNGSDMKGYTPSGGAAVGLGNWPIEFRRPSVLRVFGHAWEWAGYLNYTKSLPQYQGDLSAQNQFNYYFTNKMGGRVYTTGFNQEGYFVTAAGLTDLTTGSTRSITDLGNPNAGVDVPTDFPDGLRASEIIVDKITITGATSFSNEGRARTDKIGVVRLATIDEYKQPSPPANIASDDDSINDNPRVVTLDGLNRWKVEQKLVSSSTAIATIFVKEGSQDRNLTQMLEKPPVTPADAIPTLQRASEYANAVFGSGNQQVQIIIGAGLYTPSVSDGWRCNVKFIAYTKNLSGPIWASNSLGNINTPNNFFDGSGYGDLNNSVNFKTYSLALRDAPYSYNTLQMFLLVGQMTFYRDVDFEGGFQFLGLPELIKLVAQGTLPPSQMIFGLANSLPSDAWTANTETNIDTLLNKIRISEGRGSFYESCNFGSIIRCLGPTGSSIRIRDCVFGPGLPSHKEDLGGPRDPMIATNGSSLINIHNIYIRGTSKITSNGMGVTNDLPLANQAHYGTAIAPAPWEWKQSFHTFIGPIPFQNNPTNLALGSSFYVELFPGQVGSLNYYADFSGKLLPNHIHLLDNDGGIPTDSTSGPFFDQFVHVPSSFYCSFSWNRVAEVNQGSGVLRRQGFVGKFGNNGYNNTKTRGLLGGNTDILQPESGFTLSMSLSSLGANYGASFFKRAGLNDTETDQQGLPSFQINSTTNGNPTSFSPGQAYPTGPNNNNANTVVTAADGGSPTLGLNVGLRSYKIGIDVVAAITIPHSNIIV